MEMQNGEGKMCTCPHHKIFPLVIVAVGVLFLLQSLGVALGNWFNILWPILLILWGLKKLMRGGCKCCNDMKKM
ncbi:MAG: hypothetical protein KGH93_00730 [Patescibacteria group bacterium]|nr:hypothetical protein [Patescibacteria group bacterium]MDE1945710.1 hypothetical protein [Patescibacteria group bacterium]